MARADGREDADDGEEAGAEVGDGHADLHGRTAVAARRAHDAAHALRDQVVAAAIRVRPRLAEARDRAVDEARVDLAQRLPIHPEAPGHAGPVILDEHVRRRDKPLQHHHPRGPLESSTSERLLRLTARNDAETPGAISCSRRVCSPPGGSILTTSAPMSASSIEQNGPAMTCVWSSTRMPPSAVVIAGHSILDGAILAEP